MGMPNNPTTERRLALKTGRKFMLRRAREGARLDLHCANGHYTGFGGVFADNCDCSPSELS